VFFLFQSFWVGSREAARAPALPASGRNLRGTNNAFLGGFRTASCFSFLVAVFGPSPLFQRRLTAASSDLRDPDRVSSFLIPASLSRFIPGPVSFILWILGLARLKNNHFRPGGIVHAPDSLFFPCRELEEGPDPGADRVGPGAASHRARKWHVAGFSPAFRLDWHAGLFRSKGAEVDVLLPQTCKPGVQSLCRWTTLERDPPYPRNRVY